jgi:hypothetical protein
MLLARCGMDLRLLAQRRNRKEFHHRETHRVHEDRLITQQGRKGHKGKKSSVKDCLPAIRCFDLMMFSPIIMIHADYDFSR